MAEKLGTGKRFKKRAAQLAGAGARNPPALAAYLGRQKYGAKRFNALAKAGRERAAAEREAAKQAGERQETPPKQSGRRIRV